VEEAAELCLEPSHLDRLLAAGFGGTRGRGKKGEGVCVVGRASLTTCSWPVLVGLGVGRGMWCGVVMSLLDRLLAADFGVCVCGKGGKGKDAVGALRVSQLTVSGNNDCHQPYGTGA
jgi:hypothetical protein